jgi:hypothetical protein
VANTALSSAQENLLVQRQTNAALNSATGGSGVAATDAAKARQIANWRQANCASPDSSACDAQVYEAMGNGQVLAMGLFGGALAAPSIAALGTAGVQVLLNGIQSCASDPVLCANTAGIVGADVASYGGTGTLALGAGAKGVRTLVEDAAAARAVAQDAAAAKSYAANPGSGYGTTVIRDANGNVITPASVIPHANYTGVTGNAVPGPVNLMGDSDQFFIYASKRVDIDSNGFFDVVAHGNYKEIEIMTTSGRVVVDQRVAARVIENSPGYTGQSIRLLSCDTGACDAGFAQNLANKMNKTVLAPTELVWAYEDGRIVVAPRISNDPNSPQYEFPDLSKLGAFRKFMPGENK